jgi:hypothetical protein
MATKSAFNIQAFIGSPHIASIGSQHPGHHRWPSSVAHILHRTAVNVKQGPRCSGAKKEGSKGPDAAAAATART